MPPTTSGVRRRAAGATLLTFASAIVGAAIWTGYAQAARPALPAARASAGPAVPAQTPSAGEVALAMDAFSAPARQHADRASRSAPRAPLHRWVRPNDGPLSSPFGYRWGRLHEGIDLAGAYGSPILAATDGCITYAGPEAGYGEVIKIADWDGSESVYGHMSSFVRTAGCVKAGEQIARVGAAGDATGAHLHFGIYVGGAPVNPIPYLAKYGLHI
jgi:murein DD-endopeptidase MepM/ murein hydrolase activator NlpD